MRARSIPATNTFIMLLCSGKSVLTTPMVQDGKTSSGPGSSVRAVRCTDSTTRRSKAGLLDFMAASRAATDRGRPTNSGVNDSGKITMSRSGSSGRINRPAAPPGLSWLSVIFRTPSEEGGPWTQPRR